MKKLTYFLSAAAVALSLTSCSEDMMEMSTENSYNLQQYQNGAIERIGDPIGPQIGEEMVIHIEDQVNKIEFHALVQVLGIQPTKDGSLITVFGEAMYGAPLGEIEFTILLKDQNIQSNKLVEVAFDELTQKENRSLYLFNFTNQAGAVE